MANKAEFHPSSHRGSLLGWLWSGRSPAERVVLRDIWLYAGMLFAVGAMIALAFAGLVVWGDIRDQLPLAAVIADFVKVTLPLFLMFGLVCIVGAAILHLNTLDQWARARRNGKEPDLTRIFD